MTAGLFAPAAVRDIRRAVIHIARSSPSAGEALVAAVSQAAERVSQRPLLGRAMIQFAPARYRFWSVPGFPYLLVYDAEAFPPRILRVVHMARDLETILLGLTEEG